MTSSRQRGSAILITLVVLLALSAIGMGVVLLTEGQGRSAASNTHQKNALYVAEMGLRAGEALLVGADPNNANAILGNSSSSSCPALTQSTPHPPRTLGEFDIEHLGTYLRTDAASTGAEIAAQPVALPAPPDGGPSPQAFYSLCVRNNRSDVAAHPGAATTDNDFTVSLVSVGWVQAGSRVLAVKILEEEYTWIGTNRQLSLQKGRNASGTSSAQFGGSS